MLLYIILMFAAVGSLRAKSSTIGREFVFGILDMLDRCCHSESNIVTIDVTNVSPQTANVRLQIPFLHNDTYFNIPTGQQENIKISNKIQEDGIFKDSRGIRLSSDHDITVLVTNSFSFLNMMDVYNVLPVTSIQNKYKVLSHRGHGDSNRGSAYLVTAVYNNTNLTVHINGSSHGLILDALEVYQYLCPYYCDLTGTLLEADKIFAVIAGSTMSYDFFGYEFDYLASEMLPYSTWTTSYIVPPLFPQPDFTIKVTSDYNSSITVSNLTHSFSFTADLREMYFEKLPVVVTSSRPFAIAQYGLYHSLGNIFMTVVPGIQQYINNHVFTVPHAFYGNTWHYIAIIVPEKQKHHLMLDYESVQERNTSLRDIIQLSVPHPFSNYTILTFQTNEGFHHFWHPQKDVLFAVFVYGIGHHLGYGFFAGYSLEGNDSNSDEMTSTTESSSLSSTVQTTTINRTTGKESIGFDPSSTTESFWRVTSSTAQTTTRQMCYQCNDLVHPFLCDKVEICSSDEVCYLKSYMVSGQRKYRSGCMDAAICDAERKKAAMSDTFCHECCHNNYCNNEGCGDSGVPDRGSRGPICFHCEYVSSVDECLNVEPCESHEACIIEKYSWFGGNFHYKMGCGNFPCNEATRSVHSSHVEKRATLLCNHCCSDDYCNRNCTRGSDTDTGPAIIGYSASKQRNESSLDKVAFTQD